MVFSFGKRLLGCTRKRRIESVTKLLEKRETSIREVEKSKAYERKREWRNLANDAIGDR